MDNKTAIDNVIYLCSCAVNERMPDKDSTTSMDFYSLYKAANRHMLTAMVGMVLQSVDISTPLFTQGIALAQGKAVIFNNEFTRVSAALEDAGIWYMPLKGAVIKDFYPKFAMREMADYDILFDSSRADDVKDIMTELGFHLKTKKYRIGIDDSYIKPPVTNFEMHTSLFTDRDGETIQMYYKDVKDKLERDDGSKYRFHFRPEDFYIYMIAHEFKHYQGGGTGLRSLLDTYIYLRKNELDMSYVKEEMEKMGIREFEEKNRSLSIALFKGEKLTESQQEMLDYIISSGTFGTFEHRIENKIKKCEASRFKYMIHRVSGPFKKDTEREQFKMRYATFFKYPILLPFLPFYRFFRAIKNSPKRIRSEVNILRKAGRKSS